MTVPRTARVLAALGGAALLATGCSSQGRSDADTSTAPTSRTFAWSGPQLRVDADYGTVDVRHGARGSVTVDRRVTAVGKDPADPTWRLEGDTLDLGTVCDDGFVGLCEVRYTITVPPNTKVDVRE